MGFDISNITPYRRKELTSRDLALLKKCDSCEERTQGYCGGHSLRSDHRYCDLDCQTCRAYCCESPFGWELLHEVGGSDFSHFSWNSWDYPNHPFWYQVNGNLENTYLPVVIINLEEVFNWTRHTFSENKSIRNRWNISKETILGLSWYSRDDILDEVLELGTEKVLDEIQKYDFDFSLTPNFSIYDNWPLLQNRINLKRRFILMQQLQDRGINVIPSFYAHTREEETRLIEWINQNNVKAVSCTMQTLKCNTNAIDWHNRVEQLYNLIHATCLDKIIIAGATARNRMESLVAALGDQVIFLDAKLFRIANYGKGWFSQKSELPKLPTFLKSVEDIEFWRKHLSPPLTKIFANA